LTVPSRAALVACLALLAACGSSGQPGSPPAALETATPTAEAPGTPTPAPTPAPSATPVSTSDPIIGIMKNQEGPHGVPGPVDLPASIVAYYTVAGRCTFTIEIRRDDAKQTLVESLSRKEAGGETDAWHVSLEPGSYYVIPGEAVGCTYTINVYPE
jgi:hypothetical protein